MLRIQHCVRTGSVQTFTAPVDGWYEVHLWGARGGADTAVGDSYGQGGPGGYTTGTIRLRARQSIYVCVGGPGVTHKTGSGWGWNGGGNPGPHGWSGSGGGASDIRTASAGVGSTDWTNGLTSRLLVAAGGGGGGCNSNGSYGGGQYGGSSNGGMCGGTQNQAFGSAGFGRGGNNVSSDGGGGGGGWYGGQESHNDHGGAGGSGYCGGSSYNSVKNGNTHAGNTWIPNTSLTGNMLGNYGNCFTYFYLKEIIK